MIYLRPRNTPKSSGIVNRIQEVRIQIPAGQTSATATITAVDVANTRLHYCGLIAASSISTPNKTLLTAELTNSTTVTLTRNTSDASVAVTGWVFVKEFIAGPISAMQRGTLTIADTATSQTGSVTASSLTLSELAFLGQRCAYSSDSNLDSALCYLKQNSTTEIEAVRAGTSGATIVSYELATYSGTYFDRAECLVLTTGATNFVDFTNASAYHFDNDVIGSYGGMKTNTSNTDLTGDLISIIDVSSKGATVRRGAAGPNASVISYNRICVKPGYVKRRLITDNLALSGTSGNLTIGQQWGQVVTDFMGARATGTMTKSSFAASGSACAVYAENNGLGTTVIYAGRQDPSGSEVVTPSAQVVEWVK